VRTREPEQLGDRRLVIRKEGTAAYLRVGYHAPAVADRAFVPALLLDAVLTGAKGVNLWTSFRVPPPQRSTRLYRALVERGLASAVSGAMLPTAEPFLWTISATATDGTPLGAVESALLEALDRIRREGVTDAELARAKAQLHARMVFDDDSVTSLAHQIGFFETIASAAFVEQLPAAIAAASVQDVSAVAGDLLKPSNRTIGWFDPE